MLTFAELLDYTGQETERWEEWLRGAGDAVLEVSIGSGDRPAVRDLIAHIFIVEHRYADWLHGDVPVTYESFPARTLDELFGIHRQARAKLRDWVSRAGEDDLAAELTFTTLSVGTVTASRRKIVAHALMHGVRHWAQIATTLRQHGHPQSWPHDLLMSSALS